MTYLQSLPQSQDAEQGVLGSILLAGQRVLDLCAERGVCEIWFHHPAHWTIYDSICTMRKEGRPTDFITITQWMEDRKLLEGVGGAVFISQLFTFVPTGSNADFYLSILQEKTAQREALRACIATAEELYSANDLQSIYNLTSKAFQKTHELCVVEDKKDWDAEELLAFMDRMQVACDGKGSNNLMPFGIDAIDLETGGGMRGELVVVHGPTSTGKSCLGRKFTQHAAFERNERAAVFSLEMMYDQCIRRYVADLGNISLQSMRRGIFTKQEFNSFSSVMSRISKAPLHIYDVRRNEMTVDSIEREIRKLKKNKGLDMVMIDYLQLIRMKRKGKGDEKRRDQELQSVSTNFKLLAQELDIMMILVAQANENGSCFDSSQVESDADWVMNLMPTYKMEGKIKRITGTDGIWLSKAREGERGRKIPMELVGKYARIQNPSVKVAAAPDF